MSLLMTFDIKINAKQKNNQSDQTEPPIIPKLLYLAFIYKNIQLESIDLMPSYDEAIQLTKQPLIFRVFKHTLQLLQQCLSTVCFASLYVVSISSFF
jgi:hypothetical protein